MTGRLRVENSACIVGELIERHARERPDKLFALFDKEAAWSFEELRRRVTACAAGLEREGVRQGDFVLCWLPNSPEALCAYFAVNYLGAVFVPINTAYRGALLAHVIAKSGAKLMIAHGGLLGRLDGIVLSALEKLVVVGKSDGTPKGLQIIEHSSVYEADGAPSPPPARIEPWDTHLVLFTSGTTGPSKGVLCSYLHSYATNKGFRHQTPEDRHFIPLPLHHATGAATAYTALAQGASLALVDGFDAKAFWATVDRFEATTTGLLGSMVQFLMKQPPSPDDRTHSLKKTLIAPLDALSLDFHARFSVDVYTLFNMTELSVPIFAGPNPEERGTCGKVRPGIEVRLVDEHDFEVAQGATGELILRADEPWQFTSGYLGEPEATALTWRNGWFHTGDLFRRDREGNYFFVDRLKDTVRRRGENISSFEVESEIMTYPAVREAAIIAVPGASEDEMLAVLAPQPGATIDPAELIEYLRPRLAHFMIPRFVRVIAELPKTPTQKVQKHLLRGDGVTKDTWDREAAGIKIGREKLTS